MTDQEYLNQLFAKVHHMVIGVTLDDGTPWAVPVHIKRHDGNIFEWDSRIDTEHSKAIRQRSAISITIFSIDDDIAYYAKATAQELMDTQNDHGQARYRAAVTEAWLNESHTKRRISQ